MSVNSLTYSTCLVCKFSDLRTFNKFCHTKAIDCQSEYFVYFPAISMSSFTGASIGRGDGMRVIRMTYSMCLVYKISDLRTFKFWHTRSDSLGMPKLEGS